MGSLAILLEPLWALFQASWGMSQAPIPLWGHGLHFLHCCLSSQVVFWNLFLGFYRESFFGEYGGSGVARGGCFLRYVGISGIVWGQCFEVSVPTL